MTSKIKHIYLVVATAPICTSSGTRLGIGVNGRLPWPSIRADMDYFKLVTRDGSSTGTLHGTAPANTHNISNTVIMGRKTWSSIPGSFRPLGNRVNVIVTRSSPYQVAQGVVKDLTDQQEKLRDLSETKRKDLERKAHEDPTSVAAQRLRLAQVDNFKVVGDQSSSTVTVAASPEGHLPGIVVESELEDAFEHYAANNQPGEVFCIGGAEVYGALLNSKLRSRLRILQTEILKSDGGSFDCDTFWPEDLEMSGWQAVDVKDTHSWTGIQTPQGTLKEWEEDEKVGVKLRVRGWQLKS